ncbi:MAG: hypothetical protein RLY57_157 [Candidatus Parcubacteria bacterium]
MFSKVIFSQVVQSVGLIIVFPLGVFILYLCGVNVLPQDESFKEVSKLLVLASVWIFLWWYVFFVKFDPISIVAPKSVIQKSLSDIKAEIVTLFDSVKVDGNHVFEVLDTNDSLEVTWSQKVVYNQLLNFGIQQVQYKIFFRFLEHKHAIQAYIATLHTSGDIGTNGLGISSQWKGGFQYESGMSSIPSFNIRDEKVVIDIKKLSYGNAVMIDPVISIAQQAGWNMSFELFKHGFVRTIYQFCGIILLLISIIIGVVGIFGGFL